MSLYLPWLELAIAVPVLGAIWISRLRDPNESRKYCIGFAAASLASTLAAWIDFVLLDARAANGPWAWLPADLFVIDEFNAPLLPLTALLFLLTAVATLRTKIRRFSFGSTLASLAIVLAMLACRNPWGIIALLALETIVPFLDLQSRGRSTRIFVLHMGLFIALLVAGYLAVEIEGAAHSLWTILPVLGAVLIRAGIVPFHGWMTDLMENGAFGTALLFVTPLTGAYAAVRLVLPIAPDWILQSMGLASLATAVYAAGMSLVQREARRFFCYIFLSHSALVLAGLETSTPIGLTGALCVWLSIGLALGGFGLTLRALESRHGRLSLTRYLGLYDNTPALAVCFLLTGLASVGFPGTFGFLGTELLVDGAVQAYPFVGVAVVVAAAINGIALVRAYFLIFTGTRHASPVSLLISPRERIAVLVLTALILGGGLFPQPGVASRYHAALEILRERGAVQE